MFAEATVSLYKSMSYALLDWRPNAIKKETHKI